MRRIDAALDSAAAMCAFDFNDRSPQMTEFIIVDARLSSNGIAHPALPTVHCVDRMRCFHAHLREDDCPSGPGP
jgi:hypothetical protein